MDALAKEELVARFHAYLDAAETMQAGQDPVPPDLFTLLAELAALKSEVKLEARQVKTALEQFRELFDTLQQANAHLGEELRRRQEGERVDRQDAERDLLLELLELRDRLQAGHDQALRYRPGWMARRGGAGRFVADMADGLAMNLRRVDDTLARRGVHPLQVVGQPFDARIMHAGEVAHDPGQADGQVLGELRKGFRQRDRLLRPAEVVVNKRDRG